MDEQGENGRDPGRDSLHLDALAVSDRFRLFNFTRRDDHLAYLWVLRALDRLRAVHQVQAHSADVARRPGRARGRRTRTSPPITTWCDCASGWMRWPTIRSCTGSRTRPGRARSPATATASRSTSSASSATVRSPPSRTCSRARVRDANLSRLVFSDILEDLRALGQATASGDHDQVYRRLSRLDTVLDDMSRRAAQFHLTLAELMRSTDTSPEAFLKYKNALLTHMTDFMAELDRYLPRLAAAITAVDAGPMLGLVVRADDRPFLSDDDKHDDWRRRWAALRAWFADDDPESRAAGAAHRHPRRRLGRDRAAPPGHRGATRRGEPLIPATAPGRVGLRVPRRAGRARADDGRVQPPHRPPRRRRAR